MVQYRSIAEATYWLALSVGAIEVHRHLLLSCNDVCFARRLERGVMISNHRKVKEGKGSYGYNAANGEYGDMIEFGILDPTR